MSLEGNALPNGDLLAVLRRASHADLRKIVEALHRSLDVRIKDNPRYIAAKRDLTRVPDVIAEYLLRAGGHGLVNAWRGGGPPYPEVLRDVCRVMTVAVPDGLDIVETEALLLREVTERVWAKMTPEQRQAALNRVGGELGAAAQEAARQNGGVGAVPLGVLATLAGGQLLRMLLPELAVAVAGAAGAAGVLGSIAGMLAGPVGWAGGAVWAAAEIAGPSYRGLVPAVFQVAALRQGFLWQDEEEAA